MSTPSKRGPKKWQATPCWANVMPEGVFAHYSKAMALAELERLGYPECSETVPAFLITEGQLNAMAKRMARAIKMSAEIHVGSGADHLEEARAALRSIGLSSQRAPASAAARATAARKGVGL